MNDGMTWLAAPWAIAFGGYSVLLTRGLPDEDLPRRDAHRTSLEVLERHFGLSLPRTRVLGEPLPSVVLEIA
ncbi:hypothetical protein ACFQ9J_20380 [Streptomyces sp. NPDC056529]|uniref:hypothetical protein n=1 Tax=Streptomyces sp. NPDC056529 TaxID=3345855 RepID=UPI0036863726